MADTLTWRVAARAPYYDAHVTWQRLPHAPSTPLIPLGSDDAVRRRSAALRMVRFKNRCVAFAAASAAQR